MKRGLGRGFERVSAVLEAVGLDELFFRGPFLAS